MKPLGNGSYCFLLRISTAFFVWVKGNPADSRMRAAAMKRGVKLTSISRPIRRLDFEEFDLILAMDKQNKGIIAFTIPWPSVFFPGILMPCFPALSISGQIACGMHSLRLQQKAYHQTSSLLMFEHRGYIGCLWSMECKDITPSGCKEQGQPKLLVFAVCVWTVTYIHPSFSIIFPLKFGGVQWCGSVFGKNWSLDLRAVVMFLGMWDQVRLMCSYCRKHDITEVPDPYYGGPAGFDKVNEKGWLHHIQ